jgi:hypothetical protein
VLTIPWTVQLSKTQWQNAVCRLKQPHNLDPDLPDKKFREFCHYLDIPLVSGRTFLTLDHYIPGEGHWNEAGNKRVAEILELLYDHYILGKNVAVELQPLFEPPRPSSSTGNFAHSINDAVAQPLKEGVELPVSE